MDEKHFASEFKATYHILRDPAPKTKPVGLLGQISGCRVFCSPTYQLYQDGSTSHHLQGLAKTPPALTQTATKPLGRQAV